ncbi:DUF192 domain-containing protein [Candidatus Woesearchaeota archaeon]|nr:DUF192 domain-containing protein [Candidatus Woesearchaeota archaeon]
MIRNATKKTTIADEYRRCSSPLSKSRGLMFSPKPKTLLFTWPKEKKIPLHMLFVFFPIDVLFLDKERKVVELKEDFLPFRFYFPAKKAQYIIEAPRTTIAGSKTSIGDIITFI